MDQKKLKLQYILSYKSIRKFENFYKTNILNGLGPDPMADIWSKKILIYKNLFCKKI